MGAGDARGEGRTTNFEEPQFRKGDVKCERAQGRDRCTAVKVDVGSVLSLRLPHTQLSLNDLKRGRRRAGRR